MNKFYSLIKKHKLQVLVDKDSVVLVGAPTETTELNEYLTKKKISIQEFVEKL